LPLGLQAFYCRWNPITHVDDVKYSRISFTLEGYQAIKRIQRRKRGYSNSATEILVESLHNWIWRPMCDDETIGIRPRLDTGFLGL
jgi:hypothetical protein